MAETGIETLVKKLLRMESQKEFSGAKDLLSKRNGLRASLKEELEEGKVLSEDSKYDAGFKDTKGRVDYKKLARDIAEQGGLNFEEEKEKYRQPGKKLYYKLKEQLELPL